MLSPTTGSELSSTDLTNQTIITTFGGREIEQRKQQSKTGVKISAMTTTNINYRPAASDLKMISEPVFTNKPLGPIRTRASTQLMSLVAILFVALAGRQTETLAWHFNYHPESSNHQQNLSPQPFGNLNPNYFYQSAANQFVSGNQFYTPLANHQLEDSGQLKQSHNQQQQQQQQQGSQFLTPSTASNSLTSNGDGLMGSLSSSLGGGSSLYAPANRISSTHATVVNNELVSQLVARASGGDPGTAVDSTTSASETSSRQLQIMAGANRDNTVGGGLLESPMTGTHQAGQKVEGQVKSSTYLAPEQHELPNHDVVRSTPSPLGKILDVVVQDSSPATSNLNQTARQVAELADSRFSAVLTPVESAATTMTTTTTTTTTTTRAPVSKQRQQHSETVTIQQLKPLRRGALTVHKNSLKTTEQQIINQHERASLTNGQRYETSTTASPSSTQQLRLFPTKYRDNKLINSLLSALSDHNSAKSGTDSSSSQISSNNNVDGRQQTPAGSGMLGSIAESLKSGITSRNSIVKAAMGDNKLARTLSTVGKTIGGNKYVAGAGIAAAIAALGLTVSKLLSPYVLSGSSSSEPYSKLGFGFEQTIPSSSMFHPSFMSDAVNRNYLGTGGDSLQPPMQSGAHGNPANGIFSDSMLAAAAEHATLSHASSGGGQFGGPVAESFRPSQPSGAFVESANGHYSSFYTNQPDLGETFARPTTPGLIYDTSNMAPNQQQYQHHGSYVSGAPSQSRYPATQYDNSPAFDTTKFYSHPDHSNQQYQLSPAPFSHASVPSAAPAYETLQSGSPGGQSNTDQILAAASSDVPTAEYTQRRPAAPFSGGPRRSGAVSLKLDEGTRNLLKQQLQAESAKPRLNIERLVALRNNQRKSGTDQSNSMGLASQSTAQQQRLRPIASPSYQPRHNPPSAVDNGAARPEWPTSGTADSFSMKLGRLTDVTASGVTIKSDYKRPTQQEIVIQHHQKPSQQTMSGDDRVGPIRAGPMQTSRNEAENRPPPPAYLLIVPNSSQSQWQAGLVSPAGGQQQQQQRTKAQWQPPRVLQFFDTVGQSDLATMPGQDHEAKSREISSPPKSNGNSGGWQSLGAAKQVENSIASGIGGKNSLSVAANESDSLVASTSHNANSNNKSLAMDRDADDKQQLQIAATRSLRVSRTPSNSHRIPSLMPSGDFQATWQMVADPERRLTSMKDYGTTLQSEHSNAEGESDGALNKPQGNDSNVENDLEASSQLQRQSQQQRQDELLQVASSMGTNLIQLSHFGAGNGGDAEYQIEADNNNGGNSFESTAVNLDGEPIKPNKLIEAKANPNANNAAVSSVSPSKPIVTVAGVAASPSAASAQHDHHNQRASHRSLTIGVGGNKAAPVLFQQQHQQQGGESIEVELLPNDNDSGKQSAVGGSVTQSSSSSSLSSSDRKPIGVAGGGGQPQAANDNKAETTDSGTDGKQVGRQRAFRGLVAGSIGGS